MFNKIETIYIQVQITYIQKKNKWAQSNTDPFKIHSHKAEDQKTHLN